MQTPCQKTDHMVQILIVAGAMACANCKAGGGSCKRCVLTALVVVLGLGALIWLGRSTGSADGTAQSPSTGAAPIRIGLIPERDIFQQRNRYRTLAEYLSRQLHRPVELVTVNSYENIMRDFAERQVDAAFLGSLVTVLTVDRFDARVLVRPEAGGATTYQGVVFVPAGSSVQSIEDLAGKPIAVLRTTAGGNLFPMCELARRNMLDGPSAPRFIWAGTHDEVFNEVAEGRCDAGAIKDHRLDELEKAHPQHRMRRLITSASVPENALVVRGDLPPGFGAEIAEVLLKMDSSPAGQQALRSFGAARFVPCTLDDYRAIHDMVDGVRDVWQRTGIGGAPPRRPAAAATQPGM
jgi:phosphonate transport system substrate-binding protein